MTEYLANIEGAVGDPKSVRIFGLVERILEAASKELERLGCQHADEIIAATLAAYDNLAKAVDVPFVGEPFESMLEGWLRTVLEKSLQVIKERVCG